MYIYIYIYIYIFSISSVDVHSSLRPPEDLRAECGCVDICDRCHHFWDVCRCVVPSTSPLLGNWGYYHAGSDSLHPEPLIVLIQLHESHTPGSQLCMIADKVYI